MKTFIILIIALVMSQSFARPSVNDNDLPLYELGVGLMWVSFPDYPGASHNRKLYLPFPSAIYRGEIFRASRDEGVRGRFINSNYLELDLSFDGTMPSKAKDNKIREGMPELDMVIEAGPSLITRFIPKSKKSNLKINLHLATRYIFSTDIKKTSDRGLTINPFLSVTYNNFPSKKSSVFFSVGSKWATRKLNRYYYEVDQKYTTSFRQSYHAKSGHMEISTSLFFFHPLGKNFHAFAGIIKSFHGKSSNIDSPLLIKKNTTSLAIGFYWNFLKGPSIKHFKVSN